jgi:cell wall-associated NlpC family hydrolase
MPEGISGTGVAATAIGGLLLWSALKGAKPSEALRSLLTGKEPTGANAYPIEQKTFAAQQAEATGSSTPLGGATASAAKIIGIAASYNGQKYVWGGGHTNNPCAASGTDCSGYVSCVLNKAGIMKGSMTTGGFAKFGASVPYAQRLPGDLIVWNGGTGGGHMGIIVDAKYMWHNPCTLCGGVQLGKYPYGTRTASTAIVRRVAK